MVTTDLMMPFGDWFGVKSKAAAARGANTCRTGRNSVHLSIHLSIHPPVRPSVPTFVRPESKWSQGQLESPSEGSEGLPVETEGKLEGLDRWPEGPEGLSEGSEGLQEGSESLTEWPEGLRVHQRV